jgi:hypothetical protein
MKTLFGRWGERGGGITYIILVYNLVMDSLIELISSGINWTGELNWIANETESQTEIEEHLFKWMLKNIHVFVIKPDFFQHDLNTQY